MIGFLTGPMNHYNKPGIKTNEMQAPGLVIDSDFSFWVVLKRRVEVPGVVFFRLRKIQSWQWIMTFLKGGHFEIGNVHGISRCRGEEMVGHNQRGASCAIMHVSSGALFNYKRCLQDSEEGSEFGVKLENRGDRFCRNVSLGSVKLLYRFLLLMPSKNNRNFTSQTHRKTQRLQNANVFG